MEIVVKIASVCLGKTKNWLVFDAYVGFFDNNKKYKLEFCGSELTSSIPFTESQNERLRELLIEHFKYGPYFKKSAEKALKEKSEFII